MQMISERLENCVSINDAYLCCGHTKSYLMLRVLAKKIHIYITGYWGRQRLLITMCNHV